MANTKREKLFTEFPPVPTEKWEEVITADLKGADYERKLVWRTGEGFNVRPVLPRRKPRRSSNSWAREAGEFPVRARYARATMRWRVHQSRDGQVPRRRPTPRRSNCSTRASIRWASRSRRSCRPPRSRRCCATSTCLPSKWSFRAKASRTSWNPYWRRSKRRALAARPLPWHFVARSDHQPSVAHRRRSARPAGRSASRRCWPRLVRRTARECKGVRVVTVSGEQLLERRFDHRRGAGLHPFGRPRIPRAADGRGADRRRGGPQDPFLDGRSPPTTSWRWPSSAPPACCGPTSSKGTTPRRAARASCFAHAVTSTWNQTVYDPYVNMLRGTTEAMSAAIAGVHSLEVTPFDAAFAKPHGVLEAHRPQRRAAAEARIALRPGGRPRRRLVLRGEPHAVDRRRGLEALPRIGGEGRLRRRPSRAGFIKERVEASAAAKDKAVATRRHDAARRQPVPQLHGGGPEGDHRRSRHPSRCRRQRPHALPRRHGLRGDAPARGPLGQTAQGVHAHLRQPGDGPRPRPVLVQLLRLRRNPRAGQHLLQVDRRRA